VFLLVGGAEEIAWWRYVVVLRAIEAFEGFAWIRVLEADNTRNVEIRGARVR
jgi:hypothetical protein